MTRTFTRIASLVLLICLLTANVSFAKESDTNSEVSLDLDYLKSVMDMIKERYKDTVTDKELIEGAINGMFDTMDKYTDYYNQTEAESLFSELDGSYAGIGVRIISESGYICVVDVFESSTAQKAGIIKGDIILKVNGQSIEGKTGDEAAQLIKGKEGTKVKLEIQRVGQKDNLILEVERANVMVNPVTYRIMGDIGYIKLEIFNSNSNYYMTKALYEMNKSKIKKLVLDLRDNPGGEVDQVVKIAKNFVPKGLITKLKFKYDNYKDEEYYSDNNDLKYKLVVLVNESSASASEILAGAIQDTGSGILVGTKTYGKGKVQNIYPVLSPEAYKKYEDKFGIKIVDGYDLKKYGITPDDDEIIGWTKITTGEYYTPKGRMIDGTGLQPDYYIENKYLQNEVDIRDIDNLSKTIKPVKNDKSLDVFNAEKLLKFLGYDISKPDIIFDEKTEAAVYKFQKDNGLFPYGVLDFSTQQALNNKLEKYLSEFDNQMAKALELLK